ncbi:DUF4430 domain-containing protein, partial [bacterium]|nr:DUF4430 domain-containing protein [bacterium]
MKKKFIILTILCLVLSFSLVRAEVDQSTIDYLVSESQNQWITMALSAVGYSNPDISYIDSLNLITANDYSKTILALTSVNENPYDYNSKNYVSYVEDFVNNNQIGDPTLLNDDFWGVMALRSSGYDVNNSVIQGSKDFLLSNQNSDGGFSYVVGGSSDTNDTAAAIMALLEAGLENSSSELQNAINYLQSFQNSDGGFPYVSGSVSDSGSTAWVISALSKSGIDINSLDQDGNTPFTFLDSLFNEDGSYKWVLDDEQGSAMMTSYVAVALSDSTYPVNYYTPEVVTNELVNLRIESSSETVCDIQLEASDALEVVVNASSICGFDYNIEETGYGPYLNMIDGEVAEGESGWLYLVNWLSPPVGASEYELLNGDSVLWYYGGWDIQPLRLTLSDEQIELSESVTILVEYFNGIDWFVANEASVSVNNEIHLTDDTGQVVLNLASNGSYDVYASKENFIRSNTEELIVGSSNNSQTVNLTVNIDNPGGGGGDDVISFIVDTNS